MLGESNCVDETTDPQILLQVSTIHHIKEKFAILDLFVSKALVQVHKQKTSVFQDILVLLTEIGFYVVHQ